MAGKIARPPKLARIRRFALTLPGVEERNDKYGPSFQVNGKSFTLYWVPEERWVLRLPHHQEMMLFDTRPETFSPMRAGRLLWAYVAVENLEARELDDLVQAAWRYTAPKKLVASYSP